MSWLLEKICHYFEGIQPKQAWELGLRMIFLSTMYHEYVSKWIITVLILVKTMHGIIWLKVEHFEKPYSREVPPLNLAYFAGLFFLIVFVAAQVDLIADAYFQFECKILSMTALTSLLRYALCAKRLQIIRKLGWRQLFFSRLIVSMLCFLACLYLYVFNFRKIIMVPAFIVFYGICQKLARDYQFYGLVQVITCTTDENNHGEEKCSICLKKDVEGRLPCRHQFHWQCILTWIMQDSTCPNCRSPVVVPVRMQWRFKLRIADWNDFFLLILFSSSSSSSSSIQSEVEHPSEDSCVNVNSEEAQ